MAENQEASIGWAGEFWLSTDDTVANLIELVQVVSFGLPEDEIDQVETTHLKSPNRRREWADGLSDGGEAEIVFNYRPGSDTDEMLDDWVDARGKRAVRFVVPINGVPVKDYTTTATIAGYSPGQISPGDNKEATLRIKITGAVTKAAHV